MHHMRTWVVRREGTEGWEGLLATMSDADEAELLSLVPVGWYDLALQHRLLRAIDAHFGRGDGALIDAIGVYEAEQDLTVVHRMFLRLANPAFVLEKAGDYWGRFYTTGRWVVTRESPRSAHGRLDRVDPWDPLFGRYLSAYIERMWVLVGARDVSVTCEIEPNGMQIRGSWA